MKFKILIQFFLLIVVFLISWVIYQSYFKKKEVETFKSQIEKSNKLEGDNIIKELEYESSDDQGRKYIIKSQEGLIDEDNPDIILMTKVKAKIFLSDGTIINISSEKAKYNNKSFNTNFIDDVKLNFLNHNLASQNLDLLFDQNKIEVYNDLVYKNLDLTMNADKIEIDMISKYSKIFNFDDNKVKIEKIEN